MSSALEEEQVQIDTAITDAKVQEAKELSDVKVALEIVQDCRPSLPEAPRPFVLDWLIH